MIVGLTGGIGSGKSTIARLFEEYGVPIYIADERAKALMQSDTRVIDAIKKLLGESAYIDGNLNREYIADKIFTNSTTRNALNEIVHPAVARDFKQWVLIRDYIYVIKEAAILFENGGYKQTDFNILVTAPRDLRIDRVRKRDNASISQIKQRMDAQWDDVKKMALADVIIENIDFSKTKQEVYKIHQHLLRRFQENW
ncbi:dephospho-CoA kinase [Dokdonia sinensis]|uniref:Dephospho-CoA kinase n=1 Tax=Dokdonia sinensis TaxID=2479847 RepID=A0A3M0G4P4_9FLAO|nr:dephospho-CoA kinase [Dokdonia sinensis]RMB56129.1 dephospho-CoA kinase [Dokdonia sinensis]